MRSRNFLKRIFNLLKLLAGYYLSRATGKVYHWGKPVTASIEPTNLCTLHCPECPSGTKQLTRRRGQMDLLLFREIIKQLSPELVHLILYFQGEPYQNEDFFDMVRFARAKGIRVETSTNGQFLSEKNAAETVASGLNKLIVSVDGADQSTYERYRVGGSLNKVLQGIEAVVKQKRIQKSRKPFIEIQFIVLKTNQHQIQDIKRLGKKLGVNRVALKSAQLYNFEHGHPLMTDITRYSRYEKGPDGLFRIKNPLPDHCFRMWRGPVITWDGQVVPCCFDKDAAHVMGSVEEFPFAEIWKGKTYEKFRWKILHKRKSIDICRNCTEGMKRD